MRFSLVPKLCEACDKTKVLSEKLAYQIQIENILHHIILEEQGHECGCGNEDCQDGYEFLSQQIGEMDGICADCDGKGPYVALMIMQWLSEERLFMKEAQEEADELMAPEKNNGKAKVFSLKKAIRKKEVKILH